MSNGIVVCSICGREVHQDGPAVKVGAYEQYTWLHCEDKTPRCEGAISDFAMGKDPVGKWCGRDGWTVPQ